jgi:hypothetical protein
VWTLVSHGLLRLTGDTEWGIGRTFQAICYSSATNILLMVPCFGLYFAWVGAIWWIICAAVMTREAQKVSAWRAAFAVAGPPLLLVALAVGGAAFMMSRAFSSINAGMAAAQAGVSPAVQALSRPTETQAVLDALLAWGAEHAGAGPDHAARLVLEGRLPFTAFAASGSATAPTPVAVATLPAEAAAYRVGDYVFTYPGIDLVHGDPGLWVVVCAPTGDRSPPGTLQVVPVGRVGGTVTPIASAGFTAALEEQNQLRVKFGLSPLPDPALVREDQPAVAPK